MDNTIELSRCIQRSPLLAKTFIILHDEKQVSLLDLSTRLLKSTSQVHMLLMRLLMFGIVSKRLNSSKKAIYLWASPLSDEQLKDILEEARHQASHL